MALNFFLLIILHLHRVDGLDAEFHDHGRVFSRKVGFTAFDGLCFHGDICGVTNLFFVWEITRRCVKTEFGHCNCIRFFHCSDSWIATAEFYQRNNIAHVDLLLEALG